MKRHSINAMFSLVALCAILTAAPVQADVMDGDFSNGGGDWMTSADPGFGVSFPPAGGNPGAYAHLESSFNNPGGRACISQTFMCGEPDSGTECTIGFQFKLTPIDAAAGTGRIEVMIDGSSSVVIDHATNGWESISYVVPCGQHVIEICLVVDPQNNAWSACIDNVRAECTGTVSSDLQNWDGVKSLYR